MDKKYYSKNSEAVLTRNKQYREKNAESIKKHKSEYYLNNKEKLASYKKTYYQTPHGKAMANKARRRWRAIKRKQLHPFHNYKVETQLDLSRQRVEMCLGVDHDLDHVWPLSKGGLHHIENLKIVPSSINSRKNNNMEFKHPSLTMWYELPDWLILETIKRLDFSKALPILPTP